MAKVYDFRIVVRKAEFNQGMITVPYGNTGDVYEEQVLEATLAQAKAELSRLSAKHADKPHYAALSMRYRDDRKAPGIGKVSAIYHNPE